jgi:hypothetical protein
MNYLDFIKSDILSRVLIAKDNSKIKDNKLISLLNCRGATLNRNVVNDWRNSKSSTFMDYLDDISEITGVSVDYLLGRSFSENSLDNHTPHVYDKYDEQLWNLFNMLNEEGKRTTIGLVESLTKQNHFKKPLSDAPEETGSFSQKHSRP